MALDTCGQVLVDYLGYRNGAVQLPVTGQLNVMPGIDCKMTIIPSAHSDPFPPSALTVLTYQSA